MAAELLEAYTRWLREKGAIRSAPVAKAFATVPRHRFLRRIVASQAGPLDLPVTEPLTDELAKLIYLADEALVTRLAGDVPTSSSTQPSLMARMLEELDLAPGQRVLEIGSGTGYNAALITTITGTDVITVDVQPDVVADAQSALAGYPAVHAVLGDGYIGYPAGGPYDRIIVTCGVGGLSPAWLDQLAPGGLILAPVHHGGFHPNVAAWRSPDGRVVGRAVLCSDFMIAAGPLHPGFLRAPAVAFDWPPAEHRYPFSELDLITHLDLWFAAAVADARIDRRPVADFSAFGECALVDPSGLVLIQRDAVRAFDADQSVVDCALALVGQWQAAGRPALDEWRCEFPADSGLYRPTGWRRV